MGLMGLRARQDSGRLCLKFSCHGTEYSQTCPCKLNTLTTRPLAPWHPYINTFPHVTQITPQLPNLNINQGYRQPVPSAFCLWQFKFRSQHNVNKGKQWKAKANNPVVRINRSSAMVNLCSNDLLSSPNNDTTLIIDQSCSV